MSEVRPRKGAQSKAAEQPGKKLSKEEINAKVGNVQLMGTVRLGLSCLGLLAVLWFSYKTLTPMLQSKPVAQSQTRLTGTQYGSIKTSDVPKLKAGGKLEADVQKREAIKEAFEWSWHPYERHAWGADEYQPLSQTGSNLTESGGVGYTIVDSLDSLLLMDLIPEYQRARDWVRDNLHFDRDSQFNTFETTIRVLGGLLSAHYMSSTHASPEIQADASLYLDLATDLGERLLGAFSSPSGIPWSGINLATRVGIPDKDNQGVASLAEAASLQLELKYLSHLTGDYIFWKKAEKVTEVIRNQAIFDGIAPIFINPVNGQFVASEIRLGSRGDSYYEYLLKQWLQTNRQEPVYRDMYDEAMGGIRKHLIGKTKKSNLIFTQELHPARHPRDQTQSWQVVPKQDHLVCFLGGSFLLGVTDGGKKEVDWEKLDKRDEEDFLIGQGIVESCMKTHETATGLAPEIAMFVQWSDDRASDLDWYIKPNQNGVLIDGRNILRPETVESLFLAYRVTGDQKYRDWGWKVFQAFNKWCRVEKGGYAGIEDVQAMPPKQLDRMETFWLGETLKYLYLLFDDSDHISLDKNIFNTEAHILPVFDSEYFSPFSQS
ncbi:mannosyl-oligosaccharide alpha-1,2-mannosidase [Cryptococcus wingfieldii CBS 7118]|uniref:alpha-1,2-Mannosidase n=1 Tax=Cryptococcus wingfieldii CBS 7118 TaxID=1295528 RepID=A0A1E3J7D7_9TREE|nr:mannosyl-oligosaccharide alpha-1,2-mannosidase [Cryptococcus wingfieldii CBS 7118]ODN95851.1 mannosyl-oligosaccharide alpha-1,2-mannosidase [Cryptococcus wingfieldii CBS 7118]